MAGVYENENHVGDEVGEDDGYCSDRGEPEFDAPLEINDDNNDDYRNNFANRYREKLDEQFEQMTTDEQIRNYEELHEVFYPNTRLERIAAANAHLREQVYFPSPGPTVRARTTQERQWMEEHSKQLTPHSQTGVRADSDEDNRPAARNLRSVYLSHRDDVRASEIRRKSSSVHIERRNKPPGASSVTSDKKSLAVLAAEYDDPGRSSLSDTEPLSIAKQNLMRLLQSQDFYTMASERHSQIRKSKKSDYNKHGPA